MQEAIKATFERRKLDLPTAVPTGLTDEFSQDNLKQSQWTAFLKKSRLVAPPLTEVVNLVREKLLSAGIFEPT